jgi:hypothetical protein
MSTEPFPMGTIIAERQIAAYDEKGEKRAIVIRLGAPVRVRFPRGTRPSLDPSQPGFFRCPLQITGLDLDERVYPIAGEDAFEAMQYAINFANDLLRDGCARLGLQNRARVDESVPDHWIWRYPAEHGAAGNFVSINAPPPNSRS